MMTSAQEGVPSESNTTPNHSCLCLCLRRHSLTVPRIVCTPCSVRAHATHAYKYWAARAARPDLASSQISRSDVSTVSQIPTGSTHCNTPLPPLSSVPHHTSLFPRLSARGREQAPKCSQYLGYMYFCPDDVRAQDPASRLLMILSAASRSHEKAAAADASPSPGSSGTGILPWSARKACLAS